MAIFVGTSRPRSQSQCACIKDINMMSEVTGFPVMTKVSIHI